MPPTQSEPTLAPESVAKTCRWYQPLCNVTPVSKYLAMVIFIMLPFVGGYVGYSFAPEKVVEVPVTINVPQPDSRVTTLDATTTLPDADPMVGYVVGHQYGDLILTGNSTSSAEGYSFPSAHTFTFSGTTTIRGRIVTDQMLSPFIEVLQAGSTGLPSKQNGFSVVPDFIAYESLFSVVPELTAIFNEAQKNQGDVYEVELIVNSIVLQVGTSKVSSVVIEKISGVPKVQIIKKTETQ